MPNLYWATAAIATVALGYAYGQYLRTPAKTVPTAVEDMVSAVFEDVDPGSDDDGTTETEGKKRVVRRGGKNKFYRHWVFWGKAKFPTAWRGASKADLDCITLALSREMAAAGVRCDCIAQSVDIIAAQVILPNRQQASAAMWLASRAAGDVQRTASGWAPMRTWAEWFTGRKAGGYQFKVA